MTAATANSLHRVAAGSKLVSLPLSQSSSKALSYRNIFERRRLSLIFVHFHGISWPGSPVVAAFCLSSTTSEPLSAGNRSNGGRVGDNP